ncbi:MAG: ribonuclease III [Bacteroidetes bacterium]|nr:ribonuclease III [Bacteroidota bacterium]MBP7399111.1 ribonuclease III [Chitinophagales bacterium]MBK7108643.1 ribonuclease III [Bacteroidota bacterium]MBK8489033.1 ribonuclease III [Bacteroidota bacterium]MBK8680882.1 ribonuclease III [Bacteroidota bacterium]
MYPFRKIYNLYFSDDRSFCRRIKSITDNTPKNIAIYHLAFQHSSIHNSVHMNNERLELLGDAVIDLVIADYLFKKYPYKPEGFLTEMRSKIVSREQLNRVALKIGLSEMLKMRRTGGDLSKSSVLGNALEALVGALYIDRGYQPAYYFFKNQILKNHFEIDELEVTVYNFKSKIIEWAQKGGKDAKYEMLDERDIKGKKYYRMGLFVNGVMITEESDFSKKRAEQKASEHACRILGITLE